ncbi:MAG: GNAT family N-acetyltransferase [Oscillospiraceae bacterium]|jgi:ribosomal protein S18 acetylase RimI-like enzyme|nr:GNAT family N-acetyltransferase [Oscillospiraceae bacterium]
MEEPHLRRAERSDIPGLGRLLYQVHKVHSDARPDLFRPGARKYTDGELERLLLDHSRPVFVAEGDGQILGYAFCVHQQYPEGHSMTNVKTLYIDDLCVDQAARGRHIGRLLYQHVLDYARQQGCYNVTLNVWAANDSALGFYQKLGLQVQKLGMEKIL